MPYPNDRRKGARDGDEALSPEFLAVLMACGGEVRASDRTSDNGNERRRGRRAEDVAVDLSDASLRDTRPR